LITKKYFNGSFIAVTAIAMAISFPSATSAWGAQDIGVRSNAANVMLNRLPFEQASNIVYVNAAALKEQKNTLTFHGMQHDITELGKQYFIDFSTAPSPAAKEALRKQFQEIVGIKFLTDWLVISEHKGELMYSPLSSSDYTLLERVVRRPNPTPHPRSGTGTGATLDSGLPHYSQYININRPITSEECRFRKTWNSADGYMTFCENAYISLIYRVNWMRSLQHGTSHSMTPDAKLVRISLDADSPGAGINLNQRMQFTQVRLQIPGTVETGLAYSPFAYVYTSSAIAKDYSFSIEASNSTASILKALPESNLNAAYNHELTSSLEVGATMSSDPKALLQAQATYTQSRALSYDTQDYQVARLTEGARKITFNWEREQYPTGESLVANSTSYLSGAGNTPLDVDKISPISYKNFVPNFDVIYFASPQAEGSTDFTIKSSVNLWPITAAARRESAAGLLPYYSFHSREPWQQYKRVEELTTFSVDWDNPIFTGGRPVNLQLGSFNNRCLSGMNDGSLKVEECNLKSKNQSFIFDNLGRYFNVQLKTCLDASHLNKLQPCGSNLSQRWNWQSDSDHLENKFKQQNLAYDKWKVMNPVAQAFGSGLIMTEKTTSESDSVVSMRFISVFTDVFRPATDQGIGSGAGKR